MRTPLLLTTVAALACGGGPSTAGKEAPPSATAAMTSVALDSMPGAQQARFFQANCNCTSTGHWEIRHLAGQDDRFEWVVTGIKCVPFRIRIDSGVGMDPGSSVGAAEMYQLDSMRLFASRVTR